MKNLMYSLISFLMCLGLFLLICLLSSGCTQTMTMVHTQGMADDVVDETTTTTPSTSASIPISVMPKS